jgi:extracellular factor (EF) 3-hydroxypalmitic acid methyl ester biosynthesis protein
MAPRGSAAALKVRIRTSCPVWRSRPVQICNPSVCDSRRRSSYRPFSNAPPRQSEVVDGVELEKRSGMEGLTAHGPGQQAYLAAATAPTGSSGSEQQRKPQPSERRQRIAPQALAGRSRAVTLSCSLTLVRVATNTPIAGPPWRSAPIDAPSLTVASLPESLTVDPAVQVRKGTTGRQPLLCSEDGWTGGCELTFAPRWFAIRHCRFVGVCDGSEWLRPAEGSHRTGVVSGPRQSLCHMPPVLTQFLTTDVRTYVDELTAIESSLQPDAVPQLDEIYARLKQATHASAQACRRFEQQLGDDEQTLREAQLRFRQAIQPWFDQSWFMERGRSKPRGYPGDYLLLTGIYDNLTKGTGLGGYLDLYFLNTELARAVRSRMQAAREFLLGEIERQERPLEILNVACGPSREFTDGWTAPAYPLSVTLMDMDREALDFVERRLDREAPDGVTYRTRVYNALRMSSAENNVREFGRPDIIYSIGLCDYIPDNYLVRILRGWRESLAAGGSVYVAFKDCRAYRSTSYAWHVDWHFVSRTEDDCRRLFDEAGFDRDLLQMTRGDSPVIMNFVGRTQNETAVEPDQQLKADYPIRSF